MKRFLLFACITLLIQQNVALLSAGNKTEPDYYPLKPGTKWDYQVDANGNVVKVTNVIDKTEVVGGKSFAVQNTIVNGLVGATEYLTNDKEGLLRHKVNGMECKPPICMLKYPIKPGQTWEMEHQTGDEKIKVKVKVNGFEEVQVAAGKFKAVSVTIDTVSKGQAVNTTYWFGPNVGIVKQTAAIGGLNIKMELEKFEAAK